MTLKIYIMTKSILIHRATVNSKKHCQTCGVKIKVGDSVVTGRNFRRSPRPIRHESCARRIALID